MISTTLPARVSQVPHAITDQQSQIHTIALSNDTLLIDGCPATMQIIDTGLHLVTEAGTICVSAQAFWHAFAGAEPTADEAGLLLADSLIRVQAIQQMQQLQATFQHVYKRIQALSSVPLPTYRLNPFIQQALDAYDGTAETTQLLARVLKQDPETITAWACSIGKVPTPITLLTQDTQNGHHAQVRSTPVSAPMKPKEDEDSRAAEETPPRLQWTPEMDVQLTTAFETSHAESIKDTIAEIAERFGWPFNAVHGHVYKLKLNEKKRTPAQQHNREPESSQEGD